MELHPTCELDLKVIEFEIKMLKLKSKGLEIRKIKVKPQLGKLPNEIRMLKLRLKFLFKRMNCITLILTNQTIRYKIRC